MAAGKAPWQRSLPELLLEIRGKSSSTQKPVVFNNPLAAQIAGVTAVYQELSLVPSMTVAENIWLAHEPLTKIGQVDTRKMISETRKLLKSI